ncbi:MAG: hypothetical protein E7K85_04840 [Clostridium sp.]|uniref:hypothetical protein n=1 Tax=Clostridium TaxID=1485 RepID=UPI002330F0DE|nr:MULTISPECIES: hypothetical protein [Clostridium]MDB2119600.1 hypothetical protein [Clostridium paraputrificum]MDU2754182.1 hypothetical protein [Clostridium sp.]MDU2899911.1 hypothetical protein [Clostridium sp.]MDU4426859.1 hypothetical protein [Clostridium sp.]MDU5741251.1 hypothetical protein [Clostridium sp.]
MEMVVFYLQLGFIGAGIGFLTSLIVDKVMEVKQKKRNKELLEKVQKIINEYEEKVNKNCQDCIAVLEGIINKGEIK